MEDLLKAEIHKIITKWMEDNQYFKNHSLSEVETSINHLVEDVMPYVK
jgi:hypothetical protein